MTLSRFAPRFAAASAVFAATSPFLFASPAQQGSFRRVASFPVYLNTNIDDETVAEIVAASEDGLTLVYTDSATEKLGFVDISNPAAPVAGGAIDLPGEPTAVSVRGAHALVGVNTSVDFINTSGVLVIVDIATQTIVRSIDLGGQPDSVAVSPDGRYAAVAIENERDEDLGDGTPPQLPAGFLVIVDLLGNDPMGWQTRNVDLTGIASVFPEDPEPEFVDINRFNIAAVTMQENNHVALVSLASGEVLLSFSAGTVDLKDVDVDEDGLIDQSAALTNVPREPDAITWVGDFGLATANEGDLFGGSRGFTNWNVFGQTLFDAGSTIEHGVARIGHYPEDRSANKGAEPEGVEYGEYPGSARFLFVGCERANAVFVYRLLGGGLFGVATPMLTQILPTGVGPEGLLAIPDRDLLVVASEVDSRDDKIRSSLMIYRRTLEGAPYPSITSVDREGGAGVPIPWGALSALAVSPANDARVFTAHDSFYGKSRVFEMRTDLQNAPATIVREWPLRDAAGLLGFGLARTKAVLPGTEDFGIDSIVNGDGTVNLDLEGLAVTPDGAAFWAVTEGAGNLDAGVSNPDNRPFESPNLLLRLVPNFGTGDLDIVSVIGLPVELQRNQLRFGLEGVTESPDGNIYVCFQRAWTAAGDPSGLARIGRFSPATRRWSFAYYPLDAPTSPNGGWVGLSEITALPSGQLAILERDNQGGPDATIKRISGVDPRAVTFVEEGAGSIPVLTKALRADLLARGVFDVFAGFVFEKLEGMAILSSGDVLIVNDNDGVDDNRGETRLLTIPNLFR